MNTLLPVEIAMRNTHTGDPQIITSKGKGLHQDGSECKSDFISTLKPTYWPSDKDKILELIDFFIFEGISRNYLQIDNVESHSLTVGKT